MFKVYKTTYTFMLTTCCRDLNGGQLYLLLLFDVWWQRPTIVPVPPQYHFPEELKQKWIKWQLQVFDCFWRPMTAAFSCNPQIKSKKKGADFFWWHLNLLVVAFSSSLVFLTKALRPSSLSERWLFLHKAGLRLRIIRCWCNYTAGRITQRCKKHPVSCNYTLCRHVLRCKKDTTQMQSSFN